MEPFLKYHPKLIAALAEDIGGNKSIHQWMLVNCKELAALASAIAEIPDAYNWLLKHQFDYLAGFEEALCGNTKAYEYLVNNKHQILALIVAYRNGVEPSLQQLKNIHPVYAHLAQKIKDIFNERERDGEDLFKYMYKMQNKVGNPFR